MTEKKQPVQATPASAIAKAFTIEKKKAEKSKGVEA